MVDEDGAAKSSSGGKGMSAEGGGGGDGGCRDGARRTKKLLAGEEGDRRGTTHCLFDSKPVPWCLCCQAASFSLMTTIIFSSLR